MVSSYITGSMEDLDEFVQMQRPLTRADVAGFERQLEGDPKNPKLHCLLACHYAWWRLGLLDFVLISLSSRRWMPARLKQHEKHALWIIEHVPEDSVTRQQYVLFDRRTNPTGYARAKVLWKRIADENQSNLRVLLNAANFFSYSDPGLARLLVSRIQSLDGQHPDLSQIFARLEQLHESSAS